MSLNLPRRGFLGVAATLAAGVYVPERMYSFLWNNPVPFSMEELLRSLSQRAGMASIAFTKGENGPLLKLLGGREKETCGVKWPSSVLWPNGTRLNVGQSSKTDIVTVMRVGGIYYATTALDVE